MPSSSGITLRHVLNIAGGLPSRARGGSAAHHHRAGGPFAAWRPAAASPSAGQSVPICRWQHNDGSSKPENGDQDDGSSKASEPKKPLTPAELFPDLLGGKNADRPPSLTPSSSDIWDAAIDASKSLPYDFGASPRASAARAAEKPVSTTQQQPSATRSTYRAQEQPLPARSASSRDRLSRREQTAFEDLLEAMFKPHTHGVGAGSQRWDPKTDRRSNSFSRPMRPPSIDTRDASLSASASSYVKPSITSPVSQLGDDVWEAFEGVKETIASLPTDRDILAWAAENVFQPDTTANKAGTAGASVSSLGTSRYPPTYPLVLAHLIALFRDTFHSPYAALALFAHARDLSAESYVSGCSTGVYNEAVRTRWESLNDLEGVEALVEEMAARGVGWDRHTLRLVSGAVAQVAEKTMRAAAAASAELEGEGHSTSIADSHHIDGSTLARLAYGQRALEALPALERRVEAEVEAEERRHRAQMRRRMDELAEEGYGQARQVGWA